MKPLVLWFLADFFYLAVSALLPSATGKTFAISLAVLLGVLGVLCLPSAIRTIRNL